MRAAWLCALVAFLNSSAWAVWTPPLQAPDEPAHVYYVQYLAETGKVPRPGPTDTKSEEEQTVEAGVHRADIVATSSGARCGRRQSRSVSRSSSTRTSIASAEAVTRVSAPTRRSTTPRSSCPTNSSTPRAATRSTA